MRLYNNILGVIMNRYYQVYGDMTAEKSSEAYPYIPLCDDCVGNYEVVLTGEATSDSCYDCGCDGVDEVDCDECSGSGQISECPDCAGTEEDCPTCEGQEYSKECEECDGSGKVER